MDNWFCPRAPSPRREQALACHNPCPCMGRAQGHAAPEGDIMGCSDPKNEEGVETLGKGTKEAQRSRRTLGVQGPLWPPGDTLVPVAAWCWESSGDTWWLWGHGGSGDPQQLSWDVAGPCPRCHCPLLRAFHQEGTWHRRDGGSATHVPPALARAGTPGSKETPQGATVSPARCRGGNRGGAKGWRGLKGPFCAAGAGRGQGRGQGRGRKRAWRRHQPFVPITSHSSPFLFLLPGQDTWVPSTGREGCQGTEGTSVLSFCPSVTICILTHCSSTTVHPSVHLCPPSIPLLLPSSPSIRSSAFSIFFLYFHPSILFSIFSFPLHPSIHPLHPSIFSLPPLHPSSTSPSSSSIRPSIFFLLFIHSSSICTRSPSIHPSIHLLHLLLPLLHPSPTCPSSPPVSLPSSLHPFTQHSLHHLLTPLVPS